MKDIKDLSKEYKQVIPDDLLFSILEKKDIDSAYILSLESLLLFYRMVGKTSFPEVDDYMFAFPQLHRVLDVVPILENFFHKLKDLWNNYGD